MNTRLNRNELIPFLPTGRGGFRSTACDAGTIFQPTAIEVRPSILVPVEFDDRSRRIVSAALRLSRRMKFRLVLLHVCERMDYVPAHMLPKANDEWDEALKANARARLESLAAELGAAANVEFLTVVAPTGFLEDRILEVADEINAGLLLISTHGPTGLDHFFNGSKAERILRGARCPVYILPQSFLTTCAEPEAFRERVA